MIKFTVSTKQGGKIESVKTVSVDSFYNMRDEIHSRLEPGKFGSRFPIFLLRFEPDEWNVEELPQLQQELATIIAAFKELSPKPQQASIKTWEEINKGLLSSLYDVYRDSDGKPLLGRLSKLCERARKEARPIQIE